MQFLDFEIEIGRRLDARSTSRTALYPVSVLRSPDGGEPRCEMTFTLTGQERELKLANLENALLRSGSGTTTRRIASLEERPVQDLGKTLYDSLFAGEIGKTFDFAARAADKQGKGLRLKLRIAAPELAALPWEFMYDSRGPGTFLALSPQTPLVRYVDVPKSIATPTIESPLKILGVVANPKGYQELNVPLEKLRLEKALDTLVADGRVQLIWLKGQTWQSLRQAMWPGQGGPWHILHFIGHGDFSKNSDEGVIALEDEEGNPHQLTATQLSRLLAGESSLRLAVLNSCDGARGSNRDLFSSTAVTLVSAGIPAVVAMQYEISDEAAIEFGSSFYRAIAHGIPVDAAVAEARIAITMRTSDTAEWGIPVLYMRSPDGRLFDVDERSAAPRTPVTESPSAPPEVASPPVGAGRRAPSLAEARAAEELRERWTDALQEFWMERWDSAVELLESIVSAKPDYPGAAAKLEEARRQSRLAKLYATATRAKEAQDWDVAVDQCEELVALEPGYRDAATLLAALRQQRELSGLYAEARQLSAAGGWDAVLQVLARARAIDTNFADTDGLEARASQAIAEERRRRQVEELLAGGLAALEARHWSDAITAFENLLALDAGHRGATELVAKAKAEQLREAEAEQRAREEAERRAKAEAEERARIEAERVAREEAERRAKAEAEERARIEAERVAREEAELRAREEAERLAQAEAERRAQEEADRRAKAEAEQRARIEAERLAQAEAQRRAQEEAERRVKAEAEERARIQAEERARVGAQQAAQAEAERRAQEEAERRAKAEARERDTGVAAQPVPPVYGKRQHARPRRAPRMGRLQVVGAAVMVVAAVAIAVVATRPSPRPATLLEERPLPTVEVNGVETTPISQPQPLAAPPTAAPAVTSTPVPTSTPAPAPSPTSTVDQLWAGVLAQLDPLWSNKDWSSVITILSAFHDEHPTFAQAGDKLYSALVTHAQELIDAGSTAEAVTALEAANALSPSRTEAQDILTSLTPTPTAVPAPIRAPTPVPRQVQQPAPAQPVQPAQPVRPAATSTSAPFHP